VVDVVVVWLVRATSPPSGHTYVGCIGP